MEKGIKITSVEQLREFGRPLYEIEAEEFWEDQGWVEVSKGLWRQVREDWRGMRRVEDEGTVFDNVT